MSRKSLQLQGSQPSAPSTEVEPRSSVPSTEVEPRPPALSTEEIPSKKCKLAAWLEESGDDSGEDSIEGIINSTLNETAALMIDNSRVFYNNLKNLLRCYEGKAQKNIQPNLLGSNSGNESKGYEEKAAPCYPEISVARAFPA